MENNSIGTCKLGEFAVLLRGSANFDYVIDGFYGQCKYTNHNSKEKAEKQKDKANGTTYNCPTAKDMVYD